MERTDLGIQKWGMIGLEQTEKAFGRRRVLLILFLLLISTSGKNEQFISREQVWGRIVVNTSGFPGGSDSTESACDAGDLGSISGLGRSPRGGHGNPLQYSSLENPHGQWSLADSVQEVTKSQKQLSD